MADENVDVDDPGVPQDRKRGRNERDWKQNIAKKQRNSGEGYVSRATGRHVRGREIGAPCRDGCYDKITMPIIRELHKDFWAIGDFSLQNAYLQKCVSLIPVKRRRAVVHPNAQRRRSGTRHYTLTYNTVTYNPCKVGFLRILGISETRLRTAMCSLSPSGCPRGDRRGRHPPGCKLPDSCVNKVLAHIKSVPTVSSHYTRAKSPNMRYLSGNLNIRKMFRLYLTWMEQNYPGEKKVKLSFYRKKFRGLRLGFSPPMTDTCSRCDSLKVTIKKAPPEGKGEHEAALKEHLDKAKRGQQLLKSLAADSDPAVRCICLDLQQTLPVPRLSTSVAYYKKKLWIYNLCIHDLKKNENKFYVWDEVTGGRGSVEIASCILKWLNAEFENGDFSVLKVISDNCGGQNKNINLILMYLREIHDGRLAEIHHYYLIPGHSYMACDRAFGNIEKQIRTIGDIYDYRGYCLAISSSTVERQKVIAMRQPEFLNFSILQKEVTIRRPSKPYSFLEARHFVLGLAFREGYQLGMDYEAPLGIVRLQKGTANYRASLFNLRNVVLPPKYEAPIQLKPGKVQHLQDLLAYIPPIGNQYVKFIIDQQQALDGGEESDEEDDVDNDLDDILEYDEAAPVYTASSQSSSQ